MICCGWLSPRMSKQQKVQTVDQQAKFNRSIDWGMTAISGAVIAITSGLVGHTIAKRSHAFYRASLNNELNQFVAAAQYWREVKDTQAMEVWMRVVQPGVTNFYPLTKQVEGRLDLDFRAATQISTYFGKRPEDLTNKWKLIDGNWYSNAGNNIWYYRSVGQ